MRSGGEGKGERERVGRGGVYIYSFVYFGDRGQVFFLFERKCQPSTGGEKRGWDNMRRRIAGLGIGGPGCI